MRNLFRVLATANPAEAIATILFLLLGAIAADGMASEPPEIEASLVEPSDASESVAEIPVSEVRSERGEAKKESAFTIAIRPMVDLSRAKPTPERPDDKPLSLADLVDSATIPADIRSSVMDQLARVELCDRPAVGSERMFTHDGLMDVVGEAQRRLVTAGLEVEWKVPARSTVFSSIAGLSLDAALVDQLQRFCDGCKVETSKVVWPDVRADQIKSSNLKPFSSRPRGSFSTPIEIVTLRGKSIRGTVSGLVQYRMDVPVLSRSISAGERVGASDFKVENRDITFASDTSVRLDQLDGIVPSRPMAMGEILWRSAFRKELVLKFGDPVRVQIGGESWSVSTEGIAQAPASIGESVKVKLNRSQKLVSGVLKEKGLVEIQ